MKDDNVYLDQILDAISKTETFIGSCNEDEFKNDQKTQSAVILQLMIIGEISKKISEEAKEKIDIPWIDVAGFRNEAIHNYFGIDVDIVWQTIKEDIPLLKEKILER